MSDATTAFTIVTQAGPIRSTTRSLDDALQSARDAELAGRSVLHISEGGQVVLEGHELRAHLDA
jgi:hypothetical protein